jgi:radical SAM superfamily enzyme YgiQ (UPF0313 family)
MAQVVIFLDNMLLSSSSGKRTRNPLRISGPYRIATEVRKMGLTCQVVEMMTEFDLSELGHLCEKFISDETLILGFSTTFWYNDPSISGRISLITTFARKLNPNIKVVFGGANSLEIIRGHSSYDVDAVFLGYAEHHFILYLNSLVNKTSTPFSINMIGKAKIYDFVEKSDTFNFCNSQIVYDKSDCIIPGEPLILETGRGCIFKCKFCSYPLTGKKKLDYLKDPDVIREELIRNYEEYQIDKYILSDETFNDSNEKLEYLHKIFTSLPFKIKFGCYLRLDLINAHRHQIDLLKEMGIVGANFGIETFHEKAARTIGKGIVSAKAKNLLYDLKSTYWKNDVTIQINLIAGLPYETYDSYDETEKWILSEECLVDSISIAALGLRNPKVIKNAWMSEFELNAEKYGFRWGNDPWKWQNKNQPVKSSDEAMKIRNRLMKSVLDAKRFHYGGFFLFSNYIITQNFNNPRSFEEQLSMNRFEYTDWYIDQIKQNPFEKFVSDYKQKILNL